MSVRDTSLAAYDSIESKLSGKRREVMLCVHARFPDRSFTRKQLGYALGWSINRVTPRCGELIEMGFLEEVGTTVEDGRSAHLIRIRPAQLSLLAA